MTTQTITAPPELVEKIAALRGAFARGHTRQIEWRQRQLHAIERLLDEAEDEIAAALAQDLGRARAEAWLGDIASTKGEAAFARKHLRTWIKRKKQRLPMNQLPGSAWVQYEPLGVVLIIAPWNYPVYLALSPLVAAVAAGNCAVVKPSELTPVTSALLARLIPQYLDPDAVAVVEGAAETTQQLLSLGFDHALFTGGTAIGRKVMAAAAETLTPVTLELGGKSPVIVATDADLEVTARRIAWGRLLNSGQTCIAPDYVLVDKSVQQKLVGLIVDTVAAFRADTTAGMRIVNQRQFDRLAGYLDATKGTIVVGGQSARDSLTIDPTVIVDPDPTEPAMTEEIFGPILPVIGVDSVEQAIRFVNARPKPLALYVFSGSKSTSRRIIDAVPAGGAVVNHVAMHCLVPQLPFGGVGPSGMGAYHGEWGFQTMSHRKAVLAKTTWPDLKLLYPPYTDKALKVMRRLL
ncbi:aldehyde dehydrogenase family protein [Mycobacterium celatum]|uniref:Aldehyde dehydrogenase n=1 Tax=Mycobacterium celatum TaxID=28045 RepID=A0A1X1RM43_MYCCE|nr:aldehyde dehydrogenase family protein [Mycobacterium celatum]ORV09370.1 aldehyde dehydrogenase [Mycobacterium celatum]PIB73678.1 aldehyde dehydrogenase family protein [Mycobacterium celatum]